MTEKEKQYRREYNKRTNYAAQKRYEKKHPEINRRRCKKRRSVTYCPTITVNLEYKDVIFNLAERNNLSINKMFITAVEEKYGVILHKEEENT